MYQNCEVCVCGGGALLPQNISRVLHFGQNLCEVLHWILFQCCAIKGSNHGMMAWLKPQPSGLSFFSVTSGCALGILTPKASRSGWVFSQFQHPMVKTYNMQLNKMIYFYFLRKHMEIVIYYLRYSSLRRIAIAQLISSNCCTVPRTVLRQRWVWLTIKEVLTLDETTQRLSAHINNVIRFVLFLLCIWRRLKINIQVLKLYIVIATCICRVVNDLWFAKSTHSNQSLFTFTALCQDYGCKTSTSKSQFTVITLHVSSC